MSKRQVTAQRLLNVVTQNVRTRQKVRNRQMAKREFITKEQIKHEFPIMENDFGMVINESLHRQLDKLPTITEQEIVKPYLDKIRAEIDLYLFQNEFGAEYRKEVSQIIDKYRESEDAEAIRAKKMEGKE